MKILNHLPIDVTIMFNMHHSVKVYGFSSGDVSDAQYTIGNTFHAYIQERGSNSVNPIPFSSLMVREYPVKELHIGRVIMSDTVLTPVYYAVNQGIPGLDIKNDTNHVLALGTNTPTQPYAPQFIINPKQIFHYRGRYAFGIPLGSYLSSDVFGQVQLLIPSRGIIFEGMSVKPNYGTLLLPMVKELV